MFVNRDTVGPGRNTGAGVEIPAVRGAQEVMLPGNAPDAGGALWVHLVPDTSPCNDDVTKTVLRGRGRQRQQIIDSIEMKRGLIVEGGNRRVEPRLQIVGRLQGGIGRPAPIIPAADEKIAAAGARLGRVIGDHGIRAQPDLEPGHGCRVGGWNTARLTVLAGGQHQEETARSDYGVAKSPFERQRRIVGQSITSKADWSSADIVEFNPIR